MFSASASSIN